MLNERLERKPRRRPLKESAVPAIPSLDVIVGIPAIGTAAWVDEESLALQPVAASPGLACQSRKQALRTDTSWGRTGLLRSGISAVRRFSRPGNGALQQIGKETK